MGYVTTGSSNLVRNGDALKLDILISEENLRAILLMGVFSIGNLETIVEKEDLKNLSCELWAKIDDTNKLATFPVKICEFLFDSNDPGKRSYIFPRDYTDEYTYLILKIRAEKATVTTPSTELLITFKDKKDTSVPREIVEIPFTVIVKQAKPEINLFESNYTVLQRNKAVVLSWNIKGERYILREGLQELQKGEVTTGSGNYLINSVASGDHSYTLEVKTGDASITKIIQVRALGESKLYTNANPTGIDALFTIGNFCVSQDSSFLFSLMLKTEGGSTRINHVGYTNTNEGFSENWQRVTLSEEEKNSLKPFANSPLLHLKSTGELHGRLFFTGGSYIEPMKFNNRVAILNLDAEAGARVVITEALPWSSRTGHSAVLFPHGDEEKIWLLGGVDEWGRALNDVWVSGNGKDWDNINANGSVNVNKNNPAKMPWSPRYLAGITVELDNNGNRKELWIGGGFSEIGGTETSDIWKWNKNSWMEIKPLKINTNSYLSSGLSFVGKDTIDSTGIFLLGGYQEKTDKKKYFSRVTLNNGDYGSSQLDTSSVEFSFDTTKDSKIVTGFFKGCLWYMVLTDGGDRGITYSILFYWVPVVTSQTLILT
ncbi:hypothetical protein [Flavobacterium lipolyticum]|uniref:Uncharacterized protein n=1 Tax=Flavobacterium lipolyticum TaxID=2893754 RepID=A0ABS8M6M9_9FLAO|nr:hypothetical protein [Flavobacterium sp. F-126]MCC9020463.1 hypothetical protein [Flavobacterium sp. F-126]